MSKQGTVIKYNRAKQKGIINSQEFGSIYVNETNIINETKKLRKGDNVFFDIEYNNCGILIAKNVKTLNNKSTKFYTGQITNLSKKKGEILSSNFERILFHKKNCIEFEREYIYINAKIEYQLNLNNIPINITPIKLIPKPKPIKLTKEKNSSLLFYFGFLRKHINVLKFDENILHLFIKYYSLKYNTNINESIIKKPTKLNDYKNYGIISYLNNEIGYIKQNNKNEKKYKFYLKKLLYKSTVYVFNKGLDYIIREKDLRKQFYVGDNVSFYYNSKYGVYDIHQIRNNIIKKNINGKLLKFNLDKCIYKCFNGKILTSKYGLVYFRKYSHYLYFCIGKKVWFDLCKNQLDNSFYAINVERKAPNINCNIVKLYKKNL